VDVLGHFYVEKFSDHISTIAEKDTDLHTCLHRTLH
jgi:hypothetical protein